MHTELILDHRILPFSHILHRLSKIENDKEVQLVFSDRPENDFTTLGKTISKSQLQQASGFPFFCNMVPRSFYQRISPTASVDLGFSFAALHHLDHVPPNCQVLMLIVNLYSANNLAKMSSISWIFEHWNSFLVDRWYCPLWAPLLLARKITLLFLRRVRLRWWRCWAVFAAFEIPTYNRRLKDVREVLDEVENVWGLEEMYEKRIEHPAAAILREPEKGEGQTTVDESTRYAEIVVNWFMAVISGYLVKALREISGGENLAEEEIVSEWTRRTQEQFLKNSKDDSVICWVIY